jgi:multidrug resistance protein
VRFNVSPTVALLGVTLYVLGLGFGPMIASPISETFGRQVVYRVSLPISALFTLGAGFSTSFGSLLVCRFFAGATGSPVLAVGAGTLADMFPPRIRARATSSFLMSPFLGPAIGPFLGGFVAQYKNWQWTQWVTLFILVGSYASSFFMQETYKKIILQRRAKKLNIPPPKQVFPPGLAGIKFIMTVTLLRPVTMLFTEPIVGFMSLYNAFTFSILFAFFEAFPLVFNGIYGFTISQVGLAFLSVAIGVVIAVVTALIIDVTKFQKEYRKSVSEGRTAVAPEHRLYAAMYGSFGITIGLFWFAWTSRSGVHWIVPIIAAIPFAWGNLSIFVRFRPHVSLKRNPRSLAKLTVCGRSPQHCIWSTFTDR